MLGIEKTLKVGQMLVKYDLMIRIEKGMFRMFGHVGRMDANRLTAQIYSANVDGNVERHVSTYIYESV